MLDNQWKKAGVISSVIGVLLIFAPWLDLAYYDYYGAIYESFNGLTLFNSGYYFGVSMYIPLLISVIFAISVVRFWCVNSKYESYYQCAFWFVVLILVNCYSNNANAYYDHYPYYSELYSSGIATILVIFIPAANMIFASLSDKLMKISKSQYYETVPITTNNPSSNNVKYCPYCGTVVTDPSGEAMKFCPDCGTRQNQ